MVFVFNKSKIQEDVWNVFNVNSWNMAFAYINDYISANVNDGKAKKVMISSLISFELAL